MKVGLLPAALAVLLTAAACGGSDDPTRPDDGTPDTGGEGETRSIKSDPSFANDIQEIFNRRGCASGNCHGSSQSAGLDLRTGNAYTNLVGVAATSETGRIRVIAGDANNSYLVIKLEGRQSAGQRMPLGASPLDNTDLTNIKNWINQGAKNN